MRKTALAAALAVLATLAVAATAAAQAPLTVYASMPLQGAARPQATAVLAGARLALQQAGGQAAGRPVRLVELDSSTAVAGTWTPERVYANARRASRDASAVAYLGEFNSGGSAVTVPVTNEAGLLVVSPSNTAVGLTTAGVGADPGEPEKYYPSGVRTFGRVIPSDHVHGRAAAAALQAAGAKRVLLIHDGTVYGKGLAWDAAVSARARGMRPTIRRLARRARNRASLARAARSADGVFYGGLVASGVARLWNTLHRAKPSLPLLGAEGVALEDFTRDISRGARARTRLVVSTPEPAALGPAAAPVIAQLGGSPDPYALHGYEAMAVILDAITRGGGTREGTRAAFFATRDRASVLGTYSIDAHGDTSLTQVALYGVTASGALRFDRVIDAGA